MSWKVTEHYPYRTASIKDPIVNLPSELFREFHESLAEKAGKSHANNHEVFIVQMDYLITCGLDEFAVWFHDATMAIGHTTSVAIPGGYAHG